MRLSEIVPALVLSAACAGCSTSPPVNNPVTPLSPASSRVEGSFTSAKAPPAPLPGIHEAPVHQPQTPYATDWVPLSLWPHGRETVHNRDDSTITLETEAGSWTLQTGSRRALAGGAVVYLGFAPKQIGAAWHVHQLDLIKNVDPLALKPALIGNARPCVVLDPGHGGENKGAQSVVTGFYEKEYTLDWARRLKPLLEADGWRVELTRTNDVHLDLADRAAFATGVRADLFVSLHFNSVPSSARGEEHFGIETYCLTPPGMPSTLVRGSEKDSDRFPNNEFDRQNVQWAVRIHSALTRHSGQADRGVRRARFMGVLRWQTQPAVLVEGGFLSNRAEAKRIDDPGFRQRLAEGIAAGLRTMETARTGSPGESRTHF